MNNERMNYYSLYYSESLSLGRTTVQSSLMITILFFFNFHSKSFADYCSNEQTLLKVLYQISEQYLKFKYKESGKNLVM